MKTGKIVNYNSKRGYGYIKFDTEETTIFFHKSEIKDEFNLNDKVSFYVKLSNKGPCAINISLLQQNIPLHFEEIDLTSDINISNKVDFSNNPDLSSDLSFLAHEFN